MNALAASGDLLSTPTPAAKMVTDAISPGNVRVPADRDHGFQLIVITHSSGS